MSSKPFNVSDTRQPAIFDDDYIKCPTCKNAYHKETPNAAYINQFNLCNGCHFFYGINKKHLKKDVLTKKDTPASNDSRYFYVTFSYSVGGKRCYKKGCICLATENGEIFNAEKLEKTIRIRLKKKAKVIVIDNWIELNHADYETLSGGQ